MLIDYQILVDDKNTQGSIRNALNYDRIPAHIILEEAEQWIYRRLRVRDMLQTSETTLASGDDTIALPSRFRAPYTFWFTGTDKAEVTFTTIHRVEAAFSYDSAGSRQSNKPSLAYVDASVIQLDSPADQDYSYRFKYYAALAPLADNNLTNVLTERGLRALTCACRAFANEWLKDDKEKVYWLKLAAEAIDELNVEQDESLMGAEIDVVMV